MKKVLFSTLFAACAAMGLSSCMNGDYDANPNGVNSGTNPLSQPNTGGSGGTGGGGGGITGNFNDAAYYSWTGTDPLSVKINGTLHQATGASVLDMGGIIGITATGNGKTVSLSLPSGAANGSIHTLSSSSIATVTLQDGSTYYSPTGSGGAIYVMENDNTHIKGKFVANVKVLSGSDNRNLTEGYFNATK
jgi:hypothetical protein